MKKILLCVIFILLGYCVFGQGGQVTEQEYILNNPPKTTGELDTLITYRIKKEGPQANLNDIDVSNITHFNALFYKTPFNGDISKWDVSNVNNMSGMFLQNTTFDHDITAWEDNISPEVNTEGMFARSKIKQTNKIPSWVHKDS